MTLGTSKKAQNVTNEKTKIKKEEKGREEKPLEMSMFIHTLNHFASLIIFIAIFYCFSSQI